MSTLNKAQALPSLNNGPEISFRDSLSQFKIFVGILNTAFVPDLSSVKDYLINDLHHKTGLIKSCFTFIIDNGCIVTCLSYLEDFCHYTYK